MSRREYLDDLEAEVKAAAAILQKERYPEYIWCLYELIHQAKHYQRIAEALLNCSHGAYSFEESKVESDRSVNEYDWFRYPDDK